MAREDVLTAIGPVLTLELTVERWNVRSESFTDGKEERKGRKERLEILSVTDRNGEPFQDCAPELRIVVAVVLQVFGNILR